MVKVVIIIYELEFGILLKCKVIKLFINDDDVYLLK